jgi:hypothetical protein
VYREFPAPPLACLWIRTGASSAPILPDACSDLIWQAGRGAFVAGPDTGPVPVTSGPDAVFVGARFRPGAGGAALGLPLSELRDLRVDLADLDRALAERLPADLEPREALRRIAEIAVAAPPADAAVAEAARRLEQPQARVESLAGDLGASMRPPATGRRRSSACCASGASWPRATRTSPAPRSTPATPTRRT